MGAMTREEAEQLTARLQDALALLYDKWENGTPAYESIDDSDLGGYLGNAFTLTWEEEEEILALLPPWESGGKSKEIPIVAGFTKDYIKLRWVGKRQIVIFFRDWPRLKDKSIGELNKWTLTEAGIHWPGLDEDLGFEGKGIFEDANYPAPREGEREEDE